MHLKQLFGWQSIKIFLKSQIYRFMYFIYLINNHCIYNDTLKQSSLRGLIKNAYYYWYMYSLCLTKTTRSTWRTVAKLLSDQVVGRSTWRECSSSSIGSKMNWSIWRNLDFFSMIKRYPLNVILTSFLIIFHKWKSCSSQFFNMSSIFYICPLITKTINHLLSKLSYW